MKTLLDKLANPDDTPRDFVYDELSDLAAGRTLDEAEQTSVARAALARLDAEHDPAVLESMFNLLSTVFDNGFARAEIADSIAPALPALPVGALMHAIPIIAASARADRAALLAPLQASSNPSSAVRPSRPMTSIPKTWCRAGYTWGCWSLASAPPWCWPGQ